MRTYEGQLTVRSDSLKIEMAGDGGQAVSFFPLTEE